MAKRLNIFKGTIELISGFKPKNGRDFPLMEAHDIVVAEDGTRLDEKLESISNGKIEVDETLSIPGKAADAKAVREFVEDVVGNIHTRLKKI